MMETGVVAFQLGGWVVEILSGRLRVSAGNFGDEDEMLTFLHVFVIGGWESIQGHSKAGVNAMHGAGFAAKEFESVWILHDIGKHMYYAL